MKTHCVRGHEFTPENTRWRPYIGKPGQFRACIACTKERGKERYDQWYRSPYKDGTVRSLLDRGLGQSGATSSTPPDVRDVRAPQHDLGGVQGPPTTVPGDAA